MNIMISDSRASWLALGLICVVAGGLMLYLARADSLIVDELAHIPAGYGYVRYLDARLNPEHPLLLKALAALPLLALHPTFPLTNPAWTSEVNSQWAVGGAFLFGEKNDTDQMVFAARLAPILLTLLLIFLLYWWAKEIMGPRWALLPSVLFGLSPNVLAHGHYVTTDVAAAFGMVLASYFFLKFLREPSRPHLLYAGLATGLAMLMKFSTVLLIPYFFTLILVFYAASLARDWSLTAARERWYRFSIRAWRYFRAFVLIFVIGYVVVVYPVYFLLTWSYPQSKQVSDTTYILGSFAGGPAPAGQICKPVRCLADLDIAMSKNPVTRPLAQYALGVLMVMQRSSGGNTSYFLGQVSASGSHIYFPVVYALKEPLPILFLILGALVAAILSIWRAARDRAKTWGSKFLDYLDRDFTQFAMFLFVIFYWAYSIQSPLNIGFRHLFPTLPFVYMLIAHAWQTHMPQGAPKRWLFGFLLVWFLFESVLAFPYYLSYFNEIGGGKGNGYRYVTDSNYDWGQDFLRLTAFVNSHPEIDRIAVDHFGGVNPSYYLGTKETDWQSRKGNPAAQGIHYLAVSINTLEGAIQPTVPGFVRDPQDEYRWLTELRPIKPGIGNVPEPDYRIGTSIFVYKL